MIVIDRSASVKIGQTRSSIFWIMKHYNWRKKKKKKV